MFFLTVSVEILIGTYKLKQRKQKHIIKRD